MSAVSLTISPRSSAIKDIGRLLGRIADRPKFYAAASELMLGQTEDRFKAKAGPDGQPWRPHSNRTRSRTGVLLEDSGALRGGIHAAPTLSLARVRTADLAYAAIHNEGGQAGRGLSVTIPARPYFGFGDRDERDILDLAETMIAGR